MDFVNIQETIEEKPPRLVVYGPQGTGKSTFASQAPNNVFMQIEDGLDGIKSAKQKVETWANVLEMIEKLYEQKHTLQTLSVDSLDWLERIIHAKVCEDNKVSSLEKIGYGKGPGYALEYWDMFLKGMSALRDQRDMTIILLAHDKISTFNDPMGASYNRYMLKLNDKAAALIQEWADGILFMKTKPLLTSETTGFNKEIKKARDGGVYIHTNDAPAYQAKSRKSLSLPDEFPISANNGWIDFISQIGKGVQA